MNAEPRSEAARAAARAQASLSAHRDALLMSPGRARRGRASPKELMSARWHWAAAIRFVVAAHR